MTSPKGWPGQKKLDRLISQFVTINPSTQERNLLDVNADVAQELIATDAAEAGSTTSIINATAHAALSGDGIRFTSGALSGQEVQVYATTANTITLANDMASAPAVGNTFEILRARKPRVNASGNYTISASFTEVATAADGAPAPALVKVVAGVDDNGNTQQLHTDTSGDLQVDVLSSALPTGAATQATLATLLTDTQLRASPVDVDTGLIQGLTDAQLRATPVPVSGTVAVSNPGLTDTQLRASPVPVSAASLPLPTGAATEATLASLSAKFNSLGQKTMANSAPVVLASDQSAIPVTSASLTVVDFLDTPLLIASTSNIPASASTPLTVVSSLAANVKKVQILDTTGEWIGLYADPAGTPVLLAISGPGSDQTLELSIPAATVLGLRNMKNAAIAVGEYTINFLG